MGRNRPGGERLRHSLAADVTYPSASAAGSEAGLKDLLSTVRPIAVGRWQRRRPLQTDDPVLLATLRARVPHSPDTLRPVTALPTPPMPTTSPSYSAEYRGVRPVRTDDQHTGLLRQRHQQADRHSHEQRLDPRVLVDPRQEPAAMREQRQPDASRCVPVHPVIQASQPIENDFVATGLGTTEIETRQPKERRLRDEHRLLAWLPGMKVIQNAVDEMKSLGDETGRSGVDDRIATVGHSVTAQALRPAHRRPMRRRSRTARRSRCVDRPQTLRGCHRR